MSNGLAAARSPRISLGAAERNCEMGAAYQLDVPLDVSVGVGPNWHEAAH